jgi:hypothetical protein
MPAATLEAPAFFIALRALFATHALSRAMYPASYALVLITSVLLGYGVAQWFSEPANRVLRAWLGARVHVNERLMWIVRFVKFMRLARR